jgi:DNA-cytosine methyltransferase
MTKTALELFAGCGGAGVGLEAAGYNLAGGVEYYPQAADIYDANHKIPLTRANILDIDKIPTVDIAWGSPPCPSFSLSNPNKGETQKDINLARHFSMLLIASRPRSIAIENVPGYWGSESCNNIMADLAKAGYKLKHSVENAANYGAATTRRRLIIRASLDKISPLIRTHQKPTNIDQLSLFDRLPNWISWHDAIEHFIDELPTSYLTEKQSGAISNQILANNKKSKLLVGWSNAREGESKVLSDKEPAQTIAATVRNRPQSQTKILIDRLGYRGEPNIYSDLIPAPTIRAHTHIDDHGCYRIATNIVDSHNCYAANIKALATWQSFPSNYNWLKNRGEAGRAIGNSVPPLLAKAIALSLLPN